MSPFANKDWQDSPSTSTPLSAAALEDLETRVAAYADLAAPFINVKTDFGAVGDGTADDTTAVQAAIDALTDTATLEGGTVFFPPGVYKCTAQLVANRAAGYPDGIRLVGAGGVTDAWGGNPSMASTLKFTGTGSGSFIDARSQHGFQLVNLGVEYSSGSFTGTLIDFQHDSSGVDCAYALIQDCSINASSTLVSAAALISFDQAILSRVVGGHVGGAVCGIKFMSAGGYSNAHQLTGVTFDHCATAAIMNCNQSLDVEACWFEGTTPNSLTRAYLDDRALGAIVNGLNFKGCWFGDGGPSGTDAWIDFGNAEVRNFTFQGNFVSGGTGVGIKFNEGGAGVVIQGNYIDGVATPVDLGALGAGSDIFDGVTIQGNYFPTGQIANRDAGHRNLNISGNAGVNADNLQPSDRIRLSGHLVGTRARALDPTVVSNTANGSTGTASVVAESSDLCGTVTLTPGGTGIAAGVLCTVTLAEALGPHAFSTVRPKVQLQPRNDNAANLHVSNDATGNSTFTIRAASAPTTGQVYTWDWFMCGGVQ